MSADEGSACDGKVQKEKKNNVLPLWGNERTMNLNPLILTNIQSSHYFKVNLYELKTYHEVIDEIYYKVNHLEPWEKGSRKTAGQTGMCGGVRGVGAGGIVSTAYCLLYKLFTLKLTRKQVNGLLTHPDSPYIRALGFMYIRYTQPPADLWDWYDEYLEDTEEMDVKAGGGHVMTIGDMLRHFLTKLEWFSTLFPRIPVPIQQKLERQLSSRFPVVVPAAASVASQQQQPVQQAPRGARPPREDLDSYGEQERLSKLRRSEGEGRSPSHQGRSPRDSPQFHSREKRGSRQSSPSRGNKYPRYDSPRPRHEREPSPRPRHEREPSPRREYEPEYRHNDRYERDYKRSDRNGYSSSRDRGHRSHRAEESSRHRQKEKDFASELARERERQQHRSRDKSKERDRGGSRRS